MYFKRNCDNILLEDRQMVSKNILREFINSNKTNKEDILLFLENNKMKENTLIKELFKYLNDIEDIFLNRNNILNTVNLIQSICTYKIFSDEEIEINRLRIKRTREKFLVALKCNDDEIIRLSCNKLDEIVLSKSLSVTDAIVLIKRLIDKNEDVAVIKKMININKSCIFDSNNNLFEYTFDKFIEAFNNNSYLITYYMTLLKLFYYSDLPKDKYNNKLILLENNIYTNEVYNIIFGNKRSLTTSEIITKYEKDQKMFTAPINIITGKPLDTKNVITIDGSTYSLKDDAISINKDGNNYLVGIYITDVGSYIEYDDILDVQARNLYKNLYLKDRKIEIFPRRISSEMSLDENQSKKCISLYIIINDSGDILDYYIKNEIVNVAQNLTYNNTDLILEGQKYNEFKSEIFQLFEIASMLKERCNNKQKAWQSKECAKLYKREYDSKSNLLIGEFSILYNLLVATDANNLGIPYIYRVQDNSYLPELINEMNINLDTHSNNIVQGTFLEGYYCTYPKFHYGIQEEIYSQSSSPIRRYPDIYTQYLLHKYKFKDSSFDDSRIEELVEYMNEKEFETRLFEEEYNRSAQMLRKKHN